MSGVGDDANPCSRTAPCKTFAGAISKTAIGGIINMIDSGGFGPVTITKAISIQGEGVMASVLASGTNGIIVNAPGAKVTLRGLTVENVCPPPTTCGASDGIKVIDAAHVVVLNTVVKGFAGAGIRLASTNNARVTVRKSEIIENATGIAVAPTGTVANVAFLDDVLLTSNTNNATVDTSYGNLVAHRSTILAAPVTVTNSGTFRSYGDNVVSSGAPTASSTLQ